MLWMKNILWPWILFILLILSNANVSDFSSIFTSSFIFILTPLASIGFYFDFSKETAFQKVFMISHLTNEMDVSRPYCLDLSPALKSTAACSFLKLSFLASSNHVFPSFTSDLYSFCLLHWSLFFQNFNPNSFYTLPLNDFIYFLENYKQIFISNPDLSLMLQTHLFNKCWYKCYVVNDKNLENMENEN